MRVGLAQINPTVGDFSNNRQKILSFMDQALAASCDVVVFPEMAIPGYPAEDLLLKPAFVRANLKELQFIAKSIKKGVAIIGFIDQKNDRLYNAAAWIEKGRIRYIYHKQQLPNYGVFDEQRYFVPGQKPCVIDFKNHRIGLTICEDIWAGNAALKSLKDLKPTLVFNLSASPFHTNKMPLRYHTAGSTAKYLRSPVFYCNLIGGQDELVFDGGSFCVDARGQVKLNGPRFKENLSIINVTDKSQLSSVEKNPQHHSSEIQEIYDALVLGLTDYVNKNGFKKVALGVSGGIDSAVVAALATQALGPERVIGATMPSHFNSTETISDSHQLARNLGITLYEIAIESAYQHMTQILGPLFKDLKPDVTEENLQARIRGNLLMALSNKFGWLILTTGNKSELSTGYCTLYGDTAGGFALIKDVLKTKVFQLAEFINSQMPQHPQIPISIIKRPPTAELRLNQKDEDSLGAYENLDQIIVEYVEKNSSVGQIINKTNLDADYVHRIVRMIDRNEYKRRQAPLGVKITARSFGKDHRMPITNRFTAS